MSNLQVFKSANLPAVKSMSSALKNIRVADSGSGVILKMTKFGEWVFGADGTEVEPDATWAVNPLSFLHGFIAWGDAEVLGEKMVPISDPLPEVGTPPNGAKKGWETQIGISLLCMSGEDEGMEVRFSTTSVGGKRAVQELGMTIAEQIDKDEAKPVPIIMLGKEHYVHKSYGKVFTPKFDIQHWISMASPDAEAEPEKVEAKDEPVKAEDPPATGRRRRT